jgi:outer membrane receptor protein involved in Fe transport
VETNNELPPLAAYTLWNFAAGRSGSLGPVDWSLQLGINNATDQQYETYENRAMPGRNYQLNMIFKYNQ